MYTCTLVRVYFIHINMCMYFYMYINMNMYTLVCFLACLFLSFGFFLAPSSSKCGRNGFNTVTPCLSYHFFFEIFVRKDSFPLHFCLPPAHTYDGYIYR